MARLEPAKRAQLPDSAFAYIDNRGRRRLPIHDAAHVRNALARFSQVEFDDDAARDRARTKLLQAAKKHRIVPVGFINRQFQSERERDPRSVELPSGFVTMLMTDVEGSTALVNQLGDRYRFVLDDVRAVQRTTAEGCGGHVVEARADEFFAVFEDPGAAVTTGVTLQRQFRERTWPEGVSVRVRIGIHSGYPTRTEANYIGMAVHLTARISAASHGGQIVVSGDTKTALGPSAPEGARFKSLGPHRLRGIPEAVPLYQVMAKGLPTTFPPLRTVK